MSPVTAAQPMSGGSAPAAPPMTMFWGVVRLSEHRVDDHVERRRPSSVRNAATRFVVTASSPKLMTVRISPNTSASSGATAWAGSGRRRVRTMISSMSRSR